MIELLKGRGWLRYLPSVSMLILLSTVSIPTRDHAQDLNFRLINIERRLDQLQVRVDFVERTLQSQSLNRGNDPNSSSQLVLELQRQQLSLAEQVITMQKQMLAMQKAIDQLRDNAPEKKERPAGEEKPTPTPRKKSP